MSQEFDEVCLHFEGKSDCDAVTKANVAAILAGMISRLTSQHDLRQKTSYVGEAGNSGAHEMLSHFVSQLREHEACTTVADALVRTLAGKTPDDDIDENTKQNLAEVLKSMIRRLEDDDDDDDGDDDGDPNEE